jgi:hypothetical protein
MAVNHLIWRRRCQALYLEPPLHEDAYESFLKIELERAVNMASAKIYDIQLFFDEWLYLDLFDLINGVSHLRASHPMSFFRNLQVRIFILYRLYS